MSVTASSILLHDFQIFLFCFCISSKRVLKNDAAFSDPILFREQAELHACRRVRLS